MRSIRTKLFATYAVLLFLAVILLGAGFTWFIRGFYLDTVRQRLAEEARVSGELLKPVLTAQDVRKRIAEIDEHVTILGEQTSVRITLVAPGGEVLGDSAQNAALMDNHLSRPEIIAAQDGQTGSAIRFSHTVEQELLYVAIPLDEAGQRIGYIRLALPLAQLNQALRRVQYGLLAGLLFVLLLSLAISLKLAGSLTRPLEQMADVAEQISKGNLTSRIYLPNKDELGLLSDAINQMAQSLEEQVREVMANRDQLETILSTMVEGIVVFDADGKAVMANPATEQMLGLEKGACYGRRSLELVRSADLHEKIVAVSKDKVYSEYEIQTMIPEKKVLRVTLAPIRPQQVENNAGVLAVFHDITRLRRLEDMRSDFAANVSHELRTPLTSIRGFAETLLNGAYSEPDTALRFARIIHREAERLGVLIEDVLKLSKIEGGKITVSKAPVDVSTVINDVLEQLAPRLHDYKVKWQSPLGLPPVCGDRGLLTQALFNILDNAAKYTHTGGTISISTGVEEGLVQISVEDNGIGIPKEAQQRIFERFYRVDRARSRRLSGTGLGLAIVKHIVEAHQGHLLLESEEGKGTRVSLFFPLHEKE